MQQNMIFIPVRCSYGVQADESREHINLVLPGPYRIKPPDQQTNGSRQGNGLDIDKGKEKNNIINDYCGEKAK